MTVISRHNIRAPLVSNGAANVIATPHEWFAWTAYTTEIRANMSDYSVGQEVKIKYDLQIRKALRSAK